MFSRRAIPALLAVAAASVLIAFLCGSGPAPASPPCNVPLHDATAPVATNNDAAVAKAAAPRIDAGVDAGDDRSGRVSAHVELPDDVIMGSLFVRLDARQARFDPRGGKAVQIEFDAVPAGEHRLIAGWSITGPRVQIADVAFTLAAGEHRDLGVLALALAPTTWVRVALHGPECAPLDHRTLPAEASREAWLALPDGAAQIAVPLDAMVPVDGLGPAGLDVTASYAPRGRAPRPSTATGHLTPGQFTELRIEVGTPCTIDLAARWNGGFGWVEFYAVTAGGADAWARTSASGSATARLEIEEGELLLVASLVDRGGATQAFAQRQQRVGNGQFVELQLEPTVPVTGRWPDAGAHGQRIAIALAAWPGKELWRAIVGGDGAFTVPGLPPGQPLLMQVGDAAPRTAGIESTDNGWVVRFGAR